MQPYTSYIYTQAHEYIDAHIERTEGMETNCEEDLAYTLRIFQ